MISPGFTFLSRRPPHSTEHLFIIISEIIDKKVLCVNVTTQKYCNDNTCTLKKGEHPFIRHASTINFKDAFTPEVKLIEKALSEDTIKSHDPVSVALLKKIQKGALISPSFPIKYLSYIPH